MSADHQRYDELAVGYALHALEPEDEAEFAGHLPGCARCAQTVAETTEVMGAMAADLPAAEPSSALRDRLRAAVEATEQVRPQAVQPVVQAAAETPVPAALPSPRRRRLTLALVAAAVVAVLGLGFWNVGLRSDRAELSSTVAQQQEVVEALLSADRVELARAGADGGPVATVVPSGDRLQVVTHGLAANDTADSTYVVWGLGQGAPAALGTFDVDGSQIALRTVGSGLTGLDEFAMYGISIEPGREAPSEPTEVVATGQVTS
jgi:anti-sigma factor RsiW